MKNLLVLIAAAASIVFGMGAIPQRTVELTVGLDKPVVYSGENETVVMKITLGATGFPVSMNRPPLNIALVIDKSGSMGGQKIKDAKKAALEVVERLDKNDVLSLIVFDSEPRVLIPATRLGSGDIFRNVIYRINASGNTALYGGLSLGAAELRKKINTDALARVILLSDGLANVGPSSTSEITRLGEALAREGVTVTTVGVGLDYNEDLMTALANCSDGNSYFARKSSELPQIFAEEIGDAGALSARDLKIRIECSPGVIPVSLVGREGIIRGQTAEVGLKNLYAGGDKYILLKVAVPPGEDGSELQLARVMVDYEDLISRRKGRGEQAVLLRYSGSRKVVEDNLDSRVIKDHALTRVSVSKKRAITLSDQGHYREAAEVMKENQEYLDDVARQCGNDEELVRESENCAMFGKSITEGKGLSRYDRKRVFNESYIQLNQQRYESR